MSKCIAAHTNPGANYPGYINFTREDDGGVTVHFRGNPSDHKGEHVCGYSEGATATLSLAAADFEALAKSLIGR